MAINKRKTAVQFGRWLDITMSNKKISGRELADKIGVHDSVISRWRSGAAVPGIEACGRLAEALDVHPRRLAVTAGAMTEKMAGMPPLPMPSPTVLRERVRVQLSTIKGVDSASLQAMLRAWDETNAKESA